MEISWVVVLAFLGRLSDGVGARLRDRKRVVGLWRWRYPRSTAVIALIASLASCGPTPPGTFEVISASSPTRSRGFFVADRLNSAADPVVLGPLASDVGSVRYELDDQRRAFLFDGDLRTGVSSGGFLHLPRNPVAGALRTVDITPFDPSKWRSFRIYDAGLCSAVAAWTGSTGTPGVPAIAPTIITAFDGALAGDPVCNRRFFRIQAATVTPILRGSATAGGAETPSDRIRFSSVYRAQSAGLGGIECSPVHLTLTVEFGFRAVPGTLWSAPQCAAPDATPVPGTIDFEGVIDPGGITAQVQGFCNVGGAIEDSIRTQLYAQLPDLVRIAVRGALLAPPSMFGFDETAGRACNCPEDCDSRATDGSAWPAWGVRHSCVAGSCGIQLEPDRLNIRPEGLEVVLMEDNRDAQFSIFSLSPTGPMIQPILCGVGHNGVAPTSGPRAGTHPVVTDTTTGTVFPDSNMCP